MDAAEMNQFRMITGLQEQEIIEVLEYLPVTREQALNFYLFFNRWPSDDEASFILDCGWDLFEEMISQGICLS